MNRNISLCILFSAVICPIVNDLMAMTGERYSAKTPQIGADVKQVKSVEDLRSYINKAPCSIAGVLDALMNDTPKNLKEMREKHLRDYKELPPEESFYHNFKEDAKDIPKGVPGMIQLRREYDRIMKARKEGRPLTKADTKWLDPELPNIKFVSKDYHKEAVYNSVTGEKVQAGINQGTVNAASHSWSPGHWASSGDMARFDRCGTSSEEQQRIAKLLADNPRLRDDFIKKAGEMLKRAKELRKGESWIAAGEADELMQLELERFLEQFKKENFGEGPETNLASGEIPAPSKKDSNIGTQQQKEAMGVPTIKVPSQSCGSPVIGTSKLEELLQKRIAFLESLLADGVPATNEQLSSDNAVAQEYRAELEKLVKEIESLKISNDEKVKLGQELGQKLQPAATRLTQLMKRAVDEKLIAGLDLSAMNGMAGTSAEPSGDDGACKCTNPSIHYIKVSDSIPAAVMCRKCGKTAGVALHGKIISKNPAVSGMPVK